MDDRPSCGLVWVRFQNTADCRRLSYNHISIRPSKDIRTNYAQISELTRQNPVAITVNGKEDT